MAAASLSSDELKALFASIFNAVAASNAEFVHVILAELDQLLEEKLLCPAQAELLLHLGLKVAAQWGNVQIADLLLQLINKLCCDGNLLQNPSTSFDLLLCAGWEGHLDMMEFLAQNGADVLGQDTDCDTLLHMLCLQGPIEVVEYLIGKGVDVQRLNKKGETCLFSACRSGQTGIARLLLQHGASPNHVSAAVTTPLHVAVEKDHCAIVQLLCEHGAVFSLDSRGLSPLMLASLSRSVQCFHFFWSLQTIPLLELIEATELMAGAHTHCYNHYSTYIYLKQALTLRQSNHIPQQPQRPPVPELGNVVECQTLQELESHARDSGVLKTLGLLAVERILGTQHVEVGRQYLNLINHLFWENRHSDAIALWIYVRKSLRWEELLTQFDHALREVFVLNGSEGSLPSFTDVHCVLELRVTEMETQASLGDKEVPFFKDTPSCLKFWINFIRKSLDIVKTYNELVQLHDLARRLINVLSAHSQLSILHTAISMARADLSYRWTDKGSKSYESLISLLVKCGADMDQKDANADTPLHSLVQHAELRNPEDREDYVQTVCSLATLLLDAGAHTDARNTSRLTPLDVADEVAVKALLQRSQPLSLKCLAAAAVVQRNIPYQNRVPSIVQDFIHVHDPRHHGPQHQHHTS